MKVIAVYEDCHGSIGLVATVKRAIDFLIDDGWIDNHFEIYNSKLDSYREIGDIYGAKWQEVVKNFSLETFNDVFSPDFLLEEREIME